MRIVVDGRILEGRLRGMGYFTKRMLEELSKIDRENEYLILVNKINNIQKMPRLNENFNFYECTCPWILGDFTTLPLIINRLNPDVLWFPANTAVPWVKKKLKLL